MSVVTLIAATANESLMGKNGPYTAHTIEYVNAQGKTVKPQIFSSSALGRKFEGLNLSAGDTVNLTFVKEGNFSNLTDIEKTTKEAAAAAVKSQTKKTFTGKKKTFGYDNTGQQVGNAITNSVATLGAGKTLGQYEERALEIIRMGNRIRTLIDTGALDQTEVTPTQDDLAAENEQSEHAAQSYTVQTNTEEPF